jgi:hypothetical protein
MFSNIRIARYDKEGIVQKYVGVPLKYGPKEKAYIWMKEKRRTEEVLPMLAADLYSFDFAADRASNQKDKIIVTENDPVFSVKRVYNSVPYNIGINLNIWTLFMVDLDQILEQILPYFSPHAFVRVGIPELNLNLEIKIVLQSSNPDMAMEYGEDDFRIIKWIINFMIHGYVFKKIEDDEKLIKKEMINIYTDPRAFGLRDSTSMFTSAAPSGGAETLYLEGIRKDESAGIIYKYEIFD